MAVKRGVAKAWATLAIDTPHRTEPDPGHPLRTRSFSRIPEFGNRVLRVVWEWEDDRKMVVTVVWDRNAGRRA